MTSNALLTLALIGLPGFALTAEATVGDGAELVIRPKKAEAVAFTSQSKFEASMILGESKIDLLLKVNQEYAVESKSDPGKASTDLELTHHRVEGSVKSPMVEFVFDSKDMSERLPASFRQQIRAMTMTADKPLDVTVSKTGEVLSLAGYQDIFEGTKLAETLKRKTGRDLTNESFVDDVQLYFLQLPPRAVDVGDGWDVIMTITAFEDQIRFRPRCEVLEVAEDTVRIRFETDVEGEEEIRRWESEAEIFEAELHGEAVVSRSDGLLIQQTLQAAISSRAPSPMGGTALPAKIRQHFEVNRVTGEK